MSGAEVREVGDEVPLNFDDGLGRHDRFVKSEVERCQEEVAGEDRYEDVGVESGNESRHQS